MGAKAKVKKYVKTWEDRCYSDGIPDESPIEIIDKVPSYKRIAISILSNDLNFHSLGFQPKKTEYYNLLKRKELMQKGVPIQLKLF